MISALSAGEAGADSCHARMPHRSPQDTAACRGGSGKLSLSRVSYGGKAER